MTQPLLNTPTITYHGKSKLVSYLLFFYSHTYADLPPVPTNLLLHVKPCLLSWYIYLKAGGKKVLKLGENNIYTQVFLPLTLTHIRIDGGCLFFTFLNLLIHNLTHTLPLVVVASHSKHPTRTSGKLVQSILQYGRSNPNIGVQGPVRTVRKMLYFHSINI